MSQVRFYSEAGLLVFAELATLSETPGHDEGRASFLALLLYAAEDGATEALLNHVEHMRNTCGHPGDPSVSDLRRDGITPANGALGRQS